MIHWLCKSQAIYRGRALPASSLPTVASYATYLRRPKFIFLEKLWKNYFREWTRRLDDNRNALLVVAILLITMTYQGVLSPPEGFWQDDYKKIAKNPTDYLPWTNQSKPWTNQSVPSGLGAMPISTVFGNQSISQSHEAGTAVGFTTYPFWIFMPLNSVTFMLSSTIIFLLVPFEYIYVMFQAALVFLNMCYFSSLMVIGVSVWTVIVLVSVLPLAFYSCHIKRLFVARVVCWFIHGGKNWWNKPSLEFYVSKCVSIFVFICFSTKKFYV